MSFLLIVRFDAKFSLRYIVVFAYTRSFQHIAKFYNYNCLIVTADIHQGLYNPALRTSTPNRRETKTRN